MRLKLLLVSLAVFSCISPLSAKGAQKPNQAIPDSSAATIVWNTNEPGTSQVQYGNLSDSYPYATAEDKNLVTYHKVVIAGLKPATLYHYRVITRDAVGNEAISHDFTFTTLSTPDKMPPLISDVGVEGATSAGVTAVVQAPKAEPALPAVEKQPEFAKAEKAPEAAAPAPERKPERKREASSIIKKEPPIEEILIEEGGLLLPRGKLQIEPTTTYVHTSANRITVNGVTILPFLVIGEISSERVKRDIVLETLTARYGLFRNLQVELRVPYRYQHDRISNSATSESVRSTSGLGDIEGGIYSQVAYERGIIPDLIAGLSVKSITGKDPYGREIGLGTGHWGIKGNLTAVKTADPAIVFGSFGYTWNVERDIDNFGKVDPGDTFSYNLGCAFALNYQFGMNFQIEQLISPKMVMDGTSVPGSFTNVVNLKYGATWAINKDFSCDISVAHGLTTDSPDFVLELRFPYTF